MKYSKHLLLVGAVCLSAVSAAHAAQYRASTWLPSNNIHTESVFNFFADAVGKATNGEVEFEVFSGGVILPPKSTMQGVADGIAQMGFHTSGYTPSDLAVANALSGMAFVNSDPYVLGAAYADFIMHDEAGYKDWRKNGVIPSGAFATPAYLFICNTQKPLRTLDDIQGKRIRFPGGQISKLAQDIGISPVSIPGTEIYQALQYGQIDCGGMFATYLDGSQRLAEVSKSVTLANWAPNFNSPMHLYNVDFWKSLTMDQRRALLDVTARTQARLQIDWATKTEGSFQHALDKGIEIVEPDKSLTEAVDKWIANGIGDMAGVAKQEYGIADPEALFARFKGYLDKWQGLVASMNNRLDEEELTALLKKNLYDTVDVSKYGME